MISLYSKDELPTWDEIHYFLKNNVYSYDPDIYDHQQLDPYWNRPSRKLLLAWICNQLNKTVYEGDFSNFVYEKVDLTKNKISFMLAPNFVFEFGMFDGLHKSIGNISPPKIYTCKIPSTNEYSMYITNKHPRLDIDYLFGPFNLVAICTDIADKDIYTVLKPWDPGDTYELVIQYIFKNVIEYYKEEYRKMNE